MTDVRIKMTSLKVKAAGPEDDLAEGEFIAYASVFGNVDSYGDIVDEGAFDRTLAEWADKGDTIPVLWGHDLFDPFNNIGGLVSAEEVKSAAKADGEKPGLKVRGQLDLDNPTAAQVYRLMKGRRTTKMSFAYSVKEGQDSDEGYHLKDLDLYEVSVVQIPANQEAEILAVKSATARLVKAGRVLSSKNEAALRTARDSIDSVLTALDAQSEDGKSTQASGTTAANDDASAQEPSQATASAASEEPKSGPSVVTWEEEFSIYSTAYAGKG